MIGIASVWHETILIRPKQSFEITTTDTSTMKNDSEKGKYASPEGSATWEYFGVVSCASLMFCDGCLAGWTAPTLGILRAPDSSIMVTSSEASTLASLPIIGHAASATLTVLMADKLGRKNSLLVSGIPLVICWMLTAISRNVTVFFVARFIAGITFGLNIGIMPMYLGEISSANLRGLVGMVCGMMFTTGQLLMFTIAPYLSISTTACICLSMSTVSLISLWFVPKSPYFLTMIGNMEEAEEALVKLRGKTDVEEELEMIKMTIRRKGITEEKFSALKQLFTVSGNRKALGIKFLFLIVLSLGSYGIIMVYSSIIFNKMNTGIEPHVCTMIIASIQLSSKILIAFIVDKVGRRPLICVSGLASGLCVLIVGVYFYLMEYTDIDVTPYGLFALGIIILNAIAVNIGLMPLQIVISSEIIGIEVKATAACLLGVLGGVISAIGLKLYLLVAETWGYGHSIPFFGFAAITWSCTISILKLLPETKGKTLLEIQRELNA